ncbi:hypothetical protein [Microvirga lotononidis]|uniref:Protein involved in meta-pathway of phenol degradation n=1 Tax=Microvirga lotononidis TaxID=864069 RepID=I4YN18_9HYPH|nr:hypothetical protein [Microvirga lotononidis]EIM25360.1 hypothetical protein MicloDRAFT_00060860 [Microvirga lotononidis]WQO27340.1 hypothetical protein U0023_22295 [Microvirga lotononidis]
MRHPMTAAPALALVSCLCTASAGAQEGNGQNEANNPLTPKTTINLQDYFIPSFKGLPGRDANQFLLRGLIPHKLFGAPQLFRFTLPIANAPTFPTGSDTGLGDLTLMDLFVIPGKGIEFGIGPMLVAPTASSDALGAGKWQAGAAGIAIAPQHWGLIGGLATYQQSFAGDDDREDVKLLTFQPLLLYNLPEGFYLRSTATWSFSFENHVHYIPVGFGAGKVWQLGKTTVNAFLEPQYTVWRHGDGVPRWQLFGGGNLQFALN